MPSNRRTAPVPTSPAHGRTVPTEVHGAAGANDFLGRAPLSPEPLRLEHWQVVVKYVPLRAADIGRADTQKPRIMGLCECRPDRARQAASYRRQLEGDRISARPCSGRPHRAKEWRRQCQALGDIIFPNWPPSETATPSSPRTSGQRRASVVTARPASARRANLAADEATSSARPSMFSNSASVSARVASACRTAQRRRSRENAATRTKFVDEFETSASREDQRAVRQMEIPALLQNRARESSQTCAPRRNGALPQWTAYPYLIAVEVAVS